MDQPLLMQHGIYIRKLLRGDLGEPVITQIPVAQVFSSLFPKRQCA
jgi:ABC-type dipeptide/oligopeptide/nickel transport system permease component